MLKFFVKQERKDSTLVINPQIFSRKFKHLFTSICIGCFKTLKVFLMSSITSLSTIFKIFSDSLGRVGRMGKHTINSIREGYSDLWNEVNEVYDLS